MGYHHSPLTTKKYDQTQSMTMVIN